MWITFLIAEFGIIVYNFFMDKLQAGNSFYGRSKLIAMPNFPTIIGQYELVGQHMSDRKFHKDYVSKIEPSISLNMWQSFMRKHNKHVRVKSEELMARVVDKKIQTSQMEEDSTRKILAIADVSLDEIVENPDLLKTVSVGKRMDWLFKAMSARDSRMGIMIKKNTENRKQTVMEELLKGAQYGDIEEDEVLDGEIRQEEVEVIESKAEPVEEEPAAPQPEPKKEKVEFNPEDL